MHGSDLCVSVLYEPGVASLSLTCNCEGCIKKAQLIEEKNPKTKVMAALK